MDHFIRIRDGQPVDHPIREDNFRQAFPEIDPSNLPPEFARFQRVPRPIREFFVYNSYDPSYQWDGDIVKEVWDVTPVPEEVKAERIALEKTRPMPRGWVFDESTFNWIKAE